ncbi:UNVERIFIED_CONTAM: hypothetical protein RMT77_007129 [Armadillidium vulgare]
MGVHFYFIQKVFLFITLCFAVLFLDIIFNDKALIKHAKGIKIPVIRDFYSDEDLIIHRHLAQQVLEVEQELVKGNRKGALEKLEQAVKLLDKRFFYTNFPDFTKKKNSIKNSKILKLKSSESQKSRLWNVGLAEVEISSNSERSSSNLDSLVTVLINYCETNSEENHIYEKDLEETEKIINKLGFLKGILALDKKQGQKIQYQTFRNIQLMKIQCSSWNDNPLGALLSSVKTPFVLYFHSRRAVTPDLNLTKLFDVYNRIKEVGVIGIEEEISKNDFEFSCLQLSLDRDNLLLFQGYDYVDDNCYFCDVVSTSFLAATNILQEIKPDYSFPLPASQIDWAIQLQRHNILTLFCPSTKSEKIENIKAKGKLCEETHDKSMIKNLEYLDMKRVYIKLAKKYEVSHISFPNGTVLIFSCDEIEYQCRARSRVRQYLLPKCCLQIKNNMIKKFTTQMENLLISHRLEIGSNLGAVKFKDHIPWDFDDDVTFENLNEANFLKWKSIISRIENFPININIFTNTEDLQTYFSITWEGGFRFDSWNKVYPFLNDINDIPEDVSCLLFGYYAVKAKEFIKDPFGVAKVILKEKRNLNFSPSFWTSNLTNTTNNDILPVLKTKCFLHSYVKVGDVRVAAFFNPGKSALERYGGNLLKHEAHWRFKKSDYFWPKCLIPSHPLCLDIHPMDGNLPFL